MSSMLLASQSPRRRELMALLEYPFRVRAAGVDEEQVTDADPVINTRETARLKARAVAAELLPSGAGGFVVVGADTTVAIDGRLLGKPSSPQEAVNMLQLLRDRTHAVHTGITLIDLRNGREAAAVQTSQVTMRNYSDAEIMAYVASGDPLDKAGAYGIQHPVFRPVERLAGCFLGVMGLSVCQLIQMLLEWDMPVLARETAVAQAHRTFSCTLFETIRPWLHR